MREILLNPLVTVDEVKELLKGIAGRDTIYRLFQRYGFKLGRRLVVPRRVVEDLLEGRLALEEESGTPRRAGRGK